MTNDNHSLNNLRWRAYRSGIMNHPAVREAELKTTLALLAPQPGETILEVGTGSGYLTFPICEKLEAHGKLIAADINKEGLSELKKQAGNLPLETYFFSDSLLDKHKFKPLYQQQFDAICGLAGFHHFDNRVDNSGETGRRAFLQECLQLLKPGGRLILGDVGANTQTAEYFDAIDDPFYFAPAGHPHDFHSTEQLTALAEELGFINVQAQICEVPWKFTSLAQAKTFIHTIHNAQCSEDESFAIAEKILGIKQHQGQLTLNWQLMFFRGVKPLLANPNTVQPA